MLVIAEVENLDDSKMLTMQVEPICEDFSTEPVDTLLTSGVIEPPIACVIEPPIACVIEPPIACVIEPEITVKVGAINPLKKVLDETCVDDYSDEFEKIGKLLDDRHALLAKVR
jgi:hypothetical protein